MESAGLDSSILQQAPGTGHLTEIGDVAVRIATVSLLRGT